MANPILIFTTDLLILWFVMKTFELARIRINKLPPTSIRKIYRSSIKVHVPLKDRIINSIVMPLAKPVALLIRIPEERAEEMRTAMGRVGIPLSPAEYYAKAIVMCLLTLPLTWFLVIVGLQIATPVSLILSGAVFFKGIGELKEREREKREQIEFLMPGFIRSILYKLNDAADGNELVQANLVQIFRDYLKVAGNNIFYYDVSLLIFDMESGKVEKALNDFKKRIGIPEVSLLTNALIGIHNGIPHNSTLEILAKDMDVKARENQKRYLQKLPGKVFAACWPMVGITIIMMIYMVVADITRNAGRMGIM